MNEHDELVPTPTPAIRARRHPWALGGLWAWQTTLAVAVSWPAASLVRASLGGTPQGDAPLWDAGGHVLLDFLWHSARGLVPVVAAAEFALVIGAVAGLVPTAAAMVAMAYVTQDRRAAGGRCCVASAARAVPALLLLLAVMSIAQGITLGVGFLVGEGVDLWSHAGDARAQALGIAVGLVFVGIASGLGVVHDLSRAVVVRSRVNGLRALVLGARIFGGAPLPMWWSWAWRALLSLVPVLGAAAVATRTAGRGAPAILLLALLHQAVVLARVALRASWLAQALRSVGGACFPR